MSGANDNVDTPTRATSEKSAAGQVEANTPLNQSQTEGGKNTTSSTTHAVEMRCTGVVHRTGEEFVELGLRFVDQRTESTEDPMVVSQWQLRVTTEMLEQVLDKTFRADQLKKVVKMKASTSFLFQVRGYSDKLKAWGEWSQQARFVTFPGVVASVAEIGEDLLRLVWDRPTRDTKGIATEERPEESERVAQVQEFQLRVNREADMRQEFFETFQAGTRGHTVYGLRPATPYIVYIRYATLIGTMKEWKEVARICTQAAYNIVIRQRTEEQFVATWARSALPQSQGYLFPDATVHKYELSFTGETVEPMEPLQLAASETDYKFKNLDPGMTYGVRLRSMSREGRWGSWTKKIDVRTAEKPVASVSALGESFASFTWTRSTKEDETGARVRIQGRDVIYETEEVVELQDGVPVYHAVNLQPGCQYSFQVASQFPDDVFGLWSDTIQVRTKERCGVAFRERGEDFLTVCWTADDEDSVEKNRRFHLRVEQHIPQEFGAAGEILREAQTQLVVDNEVVADGPEVVYRVNGLLAGTEYAVTVRAWEKNEISGEQKWGEWSPVAVGSTLRSVAMQILDVGEDFVRLQWRRALATAVELERPADAKEGWFDLQYELVLGCIDTGVDIELHKEISETSYLIKNLVPGTNYVVSVRACDERKQWGLWSKLPFQTLGPIVLSPHEIGENYARFMWKRFVKDAAENGSQSVHGDSFVLQYSLFLFSTDDKDQDNVDAPSEDVDYHRGQNSEVRVIRAINSQHSSIRIDDLLPDRTYTAVIRAATTSKKWGLWSREICFRTVAPFSIPANNLSIGENYVNLVWSRDEKPAAKEGLILGDYTVISQKLRVVGIDHEYVRDHVLKPNVRELKLPDLKPATAYTITLCACNSAGEWGVWSTPVNILTRATIVTRDVEIAEDYVIVAWERKRAENTHGYPTGKGYITQYHLQCSNAKGFLYEASLVEADCPYRINNLAPDTFYNIQIKANYNDEEWGLWSTSLCCLTMKRLEVKPVLISEEFASVRITRPIQNRRSPEEDGLDKYEVRNVSYGQRRSQFFLLVTMKDEKLHPYRRERGDEHVEDAMMKEQVVRPVEISTEKDDWTETVKELKCNTVYTVAARSRLPDASYGLWSQPQNFITLAPISIVFQAIGEDFSRIEWRRDYQNLPSPNVHRGLGMISRSQIKVRDLSSSFVRSFDLDTTSTTMTIDGLQSASTYAVTARTFNDNHDWGMWCKEGKVRTLPGIGIDVEHVGEDAVWLSWLRRPDIGPEVPSDACINTDTSVKAYEMKIVGDQGFTYQRELTGQNCFFRGLLPDYQYDVLVRAQSKLGVWGMWSKKTFATLPTMRVTFGNIGEHFAVVEWRRHRPTTRSESDADEDNITEYRLKVELPGYSPVVYEIPPNVSHYKLVDLLPSMEYRIWLCARGHDGVWGLWNTETRVHTLPKLNLSINDIGENYVVASWRRLAWDGQRFPLDDENIKTWEVDGAITAYQVRIEDVDGNVVVEQMLTHMNKETRLNNLELKTVYAVRVRAKDTYGEWGLWSDAKKFATLQPVTTNLLSIGEDFVELEWQRLGKLITKRPEKRNDEEEDEDEHDDEHVLEDLDAEYDDEEEEEEIEDEVDGRGDQEEPEELSDPAPALEEPAKAEEEIDPDVLKGDEEVQKWHIRINGALPEGEKEREVMAEASEIDTVLGDLLPEQDYTIAIRAQNKSGEWGKWSTPLTTRTLPLIHTSVSYIGEDFVSLTWERPVKEEDEENVGTYGAFPWRSQMHNYKVYIRSLANVGGFGDSETDDAPQVEPSASTVGEESAVEEDSEATPDVAQETTGWRVYETSQPNLRIQNLVPGVRYNISVREQKIDLYGDLRPDYGIGSEVLIIETVQPMEVLPKNITEMDALLTWERRQQSDAADAETGATVVHSEAKSTSYELRVSTVEDLGGLSTTPTVMVNIVKAFDVSVGSFFLDKLEPDVVYSVKIRAQTDDNYWGLWTEETRFITMKHLKVRPELVNEDSLLISWYRHLPTWMHDTPKMKLPSRGDGDTSTVVDDDDTASVRVEEDPLHDTQSSSKDGAHDDSFDRSHEEEDFDVHNIVLGDYSVLAYEVFVQQIGTNFTQTLEFGSAKSSARISNLNPDSLYMIEVRSKAVHAAWSPTSKKLTMCTQRTLHVSVTKLTERYVNVKWWRSPQLVEDHLPALNKLRNELRQKAIEEERLQIIEEQKQREQLGFTEVEEEMFPTSATSGTKGTADQDHEQSEEERMRKYDAGTEHLWSENVFFGKGDITAFQIRVKGSDGTPFIEGNQHLLSFEQQKQQQLNASSSRRNKRKKGVRKTRKQKLAEQSNEERDKADAPANEDEDMCLLDVKLHSRVGEVRIEGLACLTDYDIGIRAKNMYGEWGPWSATVDVRTLSLLQLNHSGFGEHYINLFWFRNSDEKQKEEDEEAAAVGEWEEQSQKLTTAEFERLKTDMSQSEYDAFVSKRREWKNRQRAMHALRNEYVEGQQQVYSPDGTGIRGYHLRLVHENGVVVDKYFAESKSTLHAHTVTAINPNNLYIVMLCPQYDDGEWGSWSQSIKFMTQNTLQLSILYVGESFIDIEWKRAPNKKLKPEDDTPEVQYNCGASAYGQQYEVSAKYDTVKEGISVPIEMKLDVSNRTFYRIQDLMPDKKFEVAVRQWDSKGEWGLWSPSKTCITLSSMTIDLGEIGENWLSLSWRRMQSYLASKYSGIYHQFKVDPEAYYLKVEELYDNGTAEDLLRLRAKEEADEQKKQIEEQRKAEYEDLVTAPTMVSEEAVFSPPPPEECGPLDDEGRYVLIKKFTNEDGNFTLTDLKPNRFYNVQVLCQTSGGKIGNWSPDNFVLTHRQLDVQAALINEDNIKVVWKREAHRTHPRLSGPAPFTGDYILQNFELEVVGYGRNNDFKLKKAFPRFEHDFHLKNLRMNSVYSIRMRSRDQQDRWSMWSPLINAVTLKPMRVLPRRVTEQTMLVEWGREKQHSESYDTGEDQLELTFSDDKTLNYHIRVFIYSNLDMPSIDKQFPGSVNKFLVNYLQPNTPYLIQARGANAVGEWGQWSEYRVVYTMKLVRLNVTAVGEDYINVAWQREKPDEMTDTCVVEQKDEGNVVLDIDGEPVTIKTKKFPLLDEPSGDVPSVYCSEKTNIVRYSITVTRAEDTEGITIEVDAGELDTLHRIEELLPDTQYVLAIRACYGEEDWGTWSTPVETATMNLLRIDVKHVGEDYLAALWERSLNTFASTSLSLGKKEETLCYEFRVLDYTRVAMAPPQLLSAEGMEGSTSTPLEPTPTVEPELVREVLVSRNHISVNQLEPNHRYKLLVRRWYRPIACAQVAVTEASADDDPSLSEEERLKNGIDACGGLAGAWSDGLYLMTLRPMTASIEDVAEDFFNLRWQRDPDADLVNTTGCVKVPAVVMCYQVRVDQLSHDGVENDQGPGTLHLDQQFSPEDISFRVTDLQPDTVYRVEVRCNTDKNWGLWSLGVVVVTLPKLTITVHSVGEDYASIAWERKIRQIAFPDGRLAVTGSSSAVEKYQLEMYGIDHAFHLEKKFRASRTHYRIRKLEAQSLYSVRIRSCDSTNIWSLWSDKISLCTLKPIRVSFGKVAEQFVHISWAREAQLPDEYSNVAGGVVLGSTSVSSFHLCVFCLDHAPSTALLDKQFSGDTMNYKVAGLNPATSYIIIVRACNQEAQWGLWSEERIVTTLPLFNVTVSSIGENYIRFRWTREETDKLGGAEVLPAGGQKVEPTMYHVVVTGEGTTGNADKQFEPGDCGEERGCPTYTLRTLAPDNRYVITLRACYGSEEWGLWTSPVTFLTLNQLGLIVSNIEEEKADFTWGRAAQSPQHAHDPNVIVWRGTIIKYQLIIRKLAHIKAEQRRAAERALLEEKKAQFGELPDEAALDQDADDVNPGIPSGDVGDEEPQEDDIRIEREMEVKQARYVQTYCTIDQLQVNTEYHVQVRAQDDSEEWGEWTEFVFDTPPLPPGRPHLKKAGANFVLFTWDAPDPYNKFLYNVEQCIVRDRKSRSGQPEHLEWKTVDCVEEPTCRIKTMAPLNRIRFRVKCCRLDRPAPHLWSKYSELAEKASMLPPDPVQDPRVASLSRTSATIEWGKPALTEAQKGLKLTYLILLAAHEGKPALIATTRHTMHEIGELQPNTPYRVQIQVDTESGLSARNTIIKFTTKGEDGGQSSRPHTQGDVRASVDGVRLPMLGQNAKSMGPIEVTQRNSSTAPHAPRPPQEKRSSQSQARVPKPPSRERDGGPRPTSQGGKGAQQSTTEGFMDDGNFESVDPPEKSVEEFDIVGFMPSDDEGHD